MQISAINTISSCKPKSFQNNIKFKGLENLEDTFSHDENITQKNELTPNEKSKLRTQMWKCISKNDMEGLHAILQGEYSTLPLLRTAKRYYDSECRMADSWYRGGKKPDPRIGTYIHDLLIDAEIQKRSKAKTATNPYLYMIDHIKYGDNKETYAIAMIKKAVELEDANLLRMVIETLRHANKPYGEILIKALSLQHLS